MYTILKRKCEQLGITGAELSRTAYINASDVSKMLNRKIKPYPVQAVKIAAALQFDGDPMELFEEDE